MSALASMTAPLILGGVCLYGLLRGTDVFAALLRGAKDGLGVVRDILPALLILFPAIAMLRASGLLDALAALTAPALTALGIPAETAPLLFLRPFTGSGAMAAAADIIKNCGADSTAGRTAAVMLGSSETTFYVVSVYFGAAGIKKSRWAIPAAIAADLGCFLASAWAVRLMI